MPDENVLWDMLWERLGLTGPMTRSQWDLVDDVRDLITGIVSAHISDLKDEDEAKLEDLEAQSKGDKQCDM